jgi:hypothetical protein
MARAAGRTRFEHVLSAAVARLMKASITPFEPEGSQGRVVSDPATPTIERPLVGCAILHWDTFRAHSHGMTFRGSVAARSSLLVLSLAAACAAPKTPRPPKPRIRTACGVLGQAPTIQLGETKRGTITEGQIDVWAIELRQGDRITITKKVTRGSLKPDFGLFEGGYS